MKNLTTLTLAIIIFVISFILAAAVKIQMSVFTAELLFIAAGFMALVVKLQNKAMQPLPVKVKAHRKY